MSRDDAYLLDMLIAARDAASHAIDATRARHQAIEWSKMTGMRHRLAQIPPPLVYLEQVVPPETPP